MIVSSVHRVALSSSGFVVSSMKFESLIARKLTAGVEMVNNVGK